MENTPKPEVKVGEELRIFLCDGPKDSKNGECVAILKREAKSKPYLISMEWYIRFESSESLREAKFNPDLERAGRWEYII